MGQFITNFETTAAWAAFSGTSDCLKPHVSYTHDNGESYFLEATSPSHDYSQDYFTVEAIDICDFSFDCPSGGISLSTDGGETWSEEYGVTSITVSSGTKVLCKGSMEMGGGGESSSSSSGPGGGNFLTSTGRYNIEGNIFSLYYGDSFTGQTSLVESAFNGLFKDDTNIVSVENLILPATTLANYCYQGMFSGCTNLTTAPELSATTLADSCYRSMFNRCTSLTTAPELPATTLASLCYYYMFRECTSLTTAPELPATTLAYYCYGNMFFGCTSLTTAPELPATTLANNCYQNMFLGCSNLNYIKAMFTTAPSSDYMNNWVNGVASSGTFVKNAAATWTSSCGISTYPCNWTVETATS